MKNKKMEVPTRPTPNVTRAYKSAQIEHGELAPFHENVAAQQGVHLTAFGVGILAFLAGFGVCWLTFVR